MNYQSDIQTGSEKNKQKISKNKVNEKAKQTKNKKTQKNKDTENEHKTCFVEPVCVCLFLGGTTYNLTQPYKKF